MPIIIKGSQVQNVPDAAPFLAQGWSLVPAGYTTVWLGESVMHVPSVDVSYYKQQGWSDVAPPPKAPTTSSSPTSTSTPSPTQTSTPTPTSPSSPAPTTGTTGTAGAAGTRTYKDLMEAYTSGFFGGMSDGQLVRDQNGRYYYWRQNNIRPLNGPSDLQKAVVDGLARPGNEIYINLADSKPLDQPTQPTQPTADPNAKTFYRVGADIYNAATKTKISSTEWERDWTGRATEVAVPTDQQQPTSDLSVYGVLPDDRDLNAEAAMIQRIGTFMRALRDAGQISAESYNAMTAPNSPQLAKYMSAALYGGYSLGDLWRDIRVNELSSSDPSAASLKPISPNVPAQDYYKTADYSLVAREPRLNLPTEAIKSMSSDVLWGTPAYRVSDELFKELVPTIDWNDPKAWDEARKIEANVYDLLIARANAQNEQEFKVADDNWNRYVSELNRSYNLKLSTNAREAWNGLQDIFKSAQNRGVSGSGLEQESADRYMGDRRRSDQLLREGKMNDFEKNWRDQLLKNASPAQVKEAVDKMDAEDAAKGITGAQRRSELWGLRPSQETLNAYSVESVRKAFPTATDAEIKSYREQVLDDNGLYRSGLYSTAASNAYKASTDKGTYQMGQLFKRNEAENKKAYAPFQPSSMANMGLPSALSGGISGSISYNSPTGKSVEPPAGTNAAIDAAKGIAESLAGKPYQQWTPEEKTQASDYLKKSGGSAIAVSSAPAGWGLDPQTGMLKKL